MRIYPLSLTQDHLDLSDGEIHYLYWFIQGSIMIPEVRWRLRRAWGMCARHAWGAVAVEASYRHGFMHGPALLYQDLVERADAACNLAGPLKVRRLVWNLRPRGPCMMCEMGYGPGQPASAPRDLIEQGRDLQCLRKFAQDARALWQETVCGICAGNGSRARCRPHLREEGSPEDAEEVAPHCTLVKDIAKRLTVYSKSFVWGYRHLETEAGRASLISAVGWCSGWRSLYSVLDRKVPGGFTPAGAELGPSPLKESRPGSEPKQQGDGRNGR
jgi:hypothetical protein